MAASQVQKGRQLIQNERKRKIKKLMYSCKLNTFGGLDNPF